MANSKKKTVLAAEWRDLFPHYLYKFLKKNNVLEKYIVNCQKNTTMFGELMKKDGLIGALGRFPFSSPNCAFRWIDTDEGYEFWFVVSSKFSIFLMEERNKFFLENS